MLCDLWGWVNRCWSQHTLGFSLCVSSWCVVAFQPSDFSGWVIFVCQRPYPYCGDLATLCGAASVGSLPGLCCRHTHSTLTLRLWVTAAVTWCP